jgi:hypothetical protein
MWQSTRVTSHQVSKIPVANNDRWVNQITEPLCKTLFSLLTFFVTNLFKAESREVWQRLSPSRHDHPVSWPAWDRSR